MNKYNHNSWDYLVNELMQEGFWLDEAVIIATWTHNNNENKLCFDPTSMVTKIFAIFLEILIVNVVKQLEKSSMNQNWKKATVLQIRMLNNKRY